MVKIVQFLNIDKTRDGHTSVKTGKTCEGRVRDGFPTDWSRQVRDDLTVTRVLPTPNIIYAKQLTLMGNPLHSFIVGRVSV